jgi:uncharacterized protein YbjT (DUF2867 family)
MQARGSAVAAATGRVGHHVVDVLEGRGHEVIAISRSGGVDVVTGEGLAETLAGAQAVIDVATGASPEQQAAPRPPGTHNRLAARQAFGESSRRRSLFDA